MTTTTKQEVRINHPKIHLALTSYLRGIGTDASFTPNEAIDQRVNQMNLYFNEDPHYYTTERGVFIGMNYPYLDGTIDEQYNVCATILGREAAKIRFTDKAEWNRFMYKVRRVYGDASGFATDILAMLEGHRTERKMAEIDEFLDNGFHYLNSRQAEEMKKDVEAHGEDTSIYWVTLQLEMIRNALFHASVTRLLPTIKNEKIKGYVERCYPYVLYARKAQHTSQVIRATEKILQMVKPLIDEYNDSDLGSFTSLFHFKVVGSNLKEEDGNYFAGRDADEMVALTKQEEELLETLESMAGSALGTSESEEGDTSEELATAMRDHVENMTENMTLAESLAGQMEGRKEELTTKMKEAVTDDILHDLLNSTKKERKQLLKETSEEVLIRELKPTITGDLHQGITANFKSREKMLQFSYDEYMKLKEEMEPIIRKTASEIADIAQMQIDRTLHNRRRGKLNKKKLTDFAVFNDPKIFTKRMVEEEQMKMDVMLLIDVSGSNNAQMMNTKNDTYVARYVMNQIVATLLHEVLKRVRFDHSIWTFYEGGNSQQFSSPIDRSNCFEKDAGMYLKEVGAWGSNRDGYAIRYAGEYLNAQSKNDKRLMIVLSDGQPAGRNYGGEKAMADVKQAVTEVQEDGAKVVGIFTGSEHENAYFKKMYENPIFVNNESIFELPKILKKLLIEEFQEYIGQFN